MPKFNIMKHQFSFAYYTTSKIYLSVPFPPLFHKGSELLINYTIVIQLSSSKCILHNYTLTINNLLYYCCFWPHEPALMHLKAVAREAKQLLKVTVTVIEIAINS